MKRAVIVVVLLLLFCGTCNAEYWMKLNDNLDVDTDSIKTITIGYNAIVKYKIRDTYGGEVYCFSRMLNKDRQTACTVLWEHYDHKGTLVFSTSKDPGYSDNWDDWTTIPQWEIDEILQRAK